MKRFLLLLSVCFIAILATTSCSKGNDDDDDLVVKYEVVNSDSRVMSIDYTDAAGEGGWKDDPRGPWSLEIQPESKPFKATLKVSFDNSDDQTGHYTIRILVNGEEKASKEVTLGAYEFIIEEIEYQIE